MSVYDSGIRAEYVFRGGSDAMGGAAVDLLAANRRERE